MASFAHAAFFLMPFYLKNIIEEQPYKIGILLVPITVLMVTIVPIAGRIVDFRGAKLPILLGLASLADSAIVQSTYKDNSPLLYIIFGFIFSGIGWGFIFGSGAFTAISSLPQKLAGTATGVLWTFQNLSGAIGLAVAGSIFRHRERESLESGLASLNIHLTRHQEDLIRGLLSDPDHARQVLNDFTTSTTDIVLPIFRNSFMNGYTSAFSFIIGLSIAAFNLIVLIMKDIRRNKEA